MPFLHDSRNGYSSVSEGELRPFAELPSALVEEVLEKTGELSQQFRESFEELRAQRGRWRDVLIQKGILKRIGELTPPPTLPTTCGVDGSCAVERLLASDLVVAAAVAVEGLTPPSETRHWPEPRHSVWIKNEPHSEATNTILRALMIGMELELASQAPHELVFLDGSLTTPLIYFNQALNQVRSAPSLQTADALMGKMPSFLNAYHKILCSSRSDKVWVAVPKYTTRREIGNVVQAPPQFDDRGLLSLVLEPDEYTTPQGLQAPQTPWHLNRSALPSEAQETAEEVLSALNTIQVVYYRPYAWLPALRIEISRNAATNPAILSTILHGVRHQCSAPAILEPYPLYMADRMVKHLPQAIPTFRQVISQYVAEQYSGDIQEVFAGLHGYRTESGV